LINLNPKLTWLLIILLASGGYLGFRQPHAEPIPPKAPEKAAPAANTLRFGPDAPQLSFLRIQPVESHPIPLAEALNARIAYDDNRTARVFSPIAGRVTLIATEVGRKVRAGDPLLDLDSPDFAAAVSESAKANADLVRKKADYERATRLLAINAIARKDLEAAADDLKQAQAEAARAKAHLRNLGGNPLGTKGQFMLPAPISGIVSERLVTAGTEVRPDASNPLFVITDLSHLWLLVDVPEQLLRRIWVGQRVSIEVDAYPGRTFSGRVTVIGSTLDPSTHRVEMRCEVDNPKLLLKPEMFARAIPVDDKRSALPRIPNTALVTQGLYSYVFVEESPGVLQRRKVRLAAENSDYSYVSSGLNAGERIVTSGALLLNSELSGKE
jgi:membrane fusion protein, heavy metal efflux system